MIQPLKRQQIHVVEGQKPLGAHWGDRPCFWVVWVDDQGREVYDSPFFERDNAEQYATERRAQHNAWHDAHPEGI